MSNVACENTLHPTSGDDKAIVTQTSLQEDEKLDMIDPLRHLLSTSDHAEAPSTSNDVRDLPSTEDYSVVPEQLESIIDQRIVIRYFKDGTKTPILLQPDEVAQSTTSDPTDKVVSRESVASWDVSLKLDMTNGCGGKIWPAAEVLGAYIASHYSDPCSSPWHDKSIVELGSGTGLVGFLVAKFGLRNTRVYVTDQTPMLSLMEENRQANNLPNRQDGLSNGTTHVDELNWGEPIPSHIPSNPDVLLLADCVYNELAFEPLVRTMIDLSRGPIQTEILFCYQKRRKADKRFFSFLKKHFTFKDVDDDDPTRTTQYRRQGTQLLRVHLKK